MDTYDLISAPIFTIFDPFSSGVTPILTVLLPKNLAESSDGQANVDLSLSCLKPMKQQTGATMVASGAYAVHPAWHGSFVGTLMVIGISLLF
jgi:hypothetical protein